MAKPDKPFANKEDQKQFDSNTFDLAAIDAEKELTDSMSLIQICEWWTKWYMKAGHKRLGRLLLKRARAAKKP